MSAARTRPAGLHTRIPTGLAVIAAGALVSGGCASSPERSTGDGPAVTAQVSEQPMTLVERTELRERAVDVLVSSLQDPDPQLRANAIEGLAVAAGRVRPAVSLGLADENEGVRAVAAAVAGRAGLRDLASPLRPLTNDPSPYVQSAAIVSLAQLGAGVDRSPLARLLLEHPSPRVRAQAAFGLGEIGDRSALPLLREAAVTSVPRAEPAEVDSLQLQVAEAMAKLGEEDAIQSIRAALYPSRPEDLELTALAVQIIGQIEDHASVAQLKYLSAYTDGGRMMPAEVRLAIADAMARMGHAEGWFIADEYLQSRVPAIRAQVAHVYGRTARPSNLARLEAMLDDPSGLVRVAAAAALLESLGEPAPVTAAR